MKRAETCSWYLCNKLYISLPTYSFVRQVYTHSNLADNILHSFNKFAVFDNRCLVMLLHWSLHALSSPPYSIQRTQQYPRFVWYDVIQTHLLPVHGCKPVGSSKEQAWPAPYVRFFVSSITPDLRLVKHLISRGPERQLVVTHYHNTLMKLLVKRNMSFCKQLSLDWPQRKFMLVERCKKAVRTTYRVFLE